MQQQISKEQLGQYKTNISSLVLRVKSKQFNFDCGATMGRIDLPVENRFGLAWHYANTKSLEDFIASVQKFIETSGNKLTTKDIKNLEVQYMSASKDLNGINNNQQKLEFD